MTLHDAAILHVSQWWKRTMRCGYAYAEGAHLHGATAEKHRVKASRSVWIWGLGIPLVTLFISTFLGIWGLAILLIYPAQVIRLALNGTRTYRENWWRSLFMVLGKFPEAVGQLNFLYNRLAGRTARLIEYK